jgi:hypothetical protein
MSSPISAAGRDFTRPFIGAFIKRRTIRFSSKGNGMRSITVRQEFPGRNIHCPSYYRPHSFSIAALSASNLTLSFFAMNSLFTMTDGQGGGAFSILYSFDVFLITLISAPNSFSARPAASMMDNQRFPIGSFMYKVIIVFSMCVSFHV